MLTALLALLVGCSPSEGERDSTSKEQMCKTANDYIWRVNQFGNSPPSPARAEGELTRIVNLSESLVKQVPDSKREQAQDVRRGITRAKEIFAKYDYGRSGDMPPESSDELREALNSYREVSQRYVQWLTDECAPDGGQWPTPPPEQ